MMLQSSVCGALYALQRSVLLIIFLHKDQYVKKTQTPNINTEDKMYMGHNIWREQLQDRPKFWDHGHNFEPSDCQLHLPR